MIVAKWRAGQTAVQIALEMPEIGLNAVYCVINYHVPYAERQARKPPKERP